MTDDKQPLPAEKVETVTRRILREVSGILDRNQRSYALGKKLKRYDAATILEIFRLMAQRAQSKDPIYQDGFRVVSDVRRISRHVGYGLMSEVYTLARQKDYREVLRFMQVVPAARKLGEDDELEEDVMLKEMTLGIKRQKARGFDRDMIMRLCNEQDPMIIEHLLKNPRVTIQHVVKIAAKRPTDAKILWTVYKNMKWVNHYVVKKALINNPYTPTQISLALLHFLLEQDLEDVAENQLLHPLVRDAAVDIIKKKRGDIDKDTKKAVESE